MPFTATDPKLSRIEAVNVLPRGAGAGGPAGLEQQAEHESQWAAIGPAASKIGCSGETLRKWVRQSERDVASARR